MDRYEMMADEALCDTQYTYIQMCTYLQTMSMNFATVADAASWTLACG